MTVHQCPFPYPGPMITSFVCPFCRGLYILTYGPRYGFLWLKRDLVWKRVWD